MNRNSALIWLPKIDGLGFPSPKTIIVPYDHRFFAAGMEDGDDLREPMKALGFEIISACEKVGWPSFIRTDLGSAKHSGPSAYLADNPLSVKQVLYSTIEDQEMKFWTEREGPKVFLVRQFLDLDASFAAFDGLPISREWRFFADGEKVQCYHPYWPESALEGRVDDPLWREKLSNHHSIPDCFDNLCDMAIGAAGSCGGDWSVDFAMDKAGKWWLIDMAVKKDSWHWPGCIGGAKQC
jgi:hypothetical protein